jgi:hypothetical protein
MTVCPWCGTPVVPNPTGRRRRYCAVECKQDHANLKRLRGAEIHDLLCKWRSNYRNRPLLTDIGRIVAGWLVEDERRIASRQHPEEPEGTV